MGVVAIDGDIYYNIIYNMYSYKLLNYILKYCFRADSVYYGRVVVMLPVVLFYK